MYIQGIDNRVFKDFKESYLKSLVEAYPGKLVLSKILNDIDETRSKLNVKLLSNLNVNYWLVRGWSENEALEKIQHLKSKRKKPKYTILQINYWIDKGFTEEEAKRKISEIQTKNVIAFNEKRKNNPNKYKQSSPMTAEFWNSKGLSVEEAYRKIKSFRKNNISYWIKRGFDEEEAIKQVSSFQKEANNSLLKRKNENPEKYKGCSPTQLQYWKNKSSSIEEAKEKLRNYQTTFSLQTCIKKYGETNGYLVWKERQDKWKQKVFNKTTYTGNGRSKLSNDIILSIIQILGESDFLYGEKEKFIYDSEYKRAYKYDLTKLSNKKIIEINGIFWHCKPTLYESHYMHNVRKMTAQQIWEYDSRKISLATEYGYEVLTVWEDEYYEDPLKLIVKCVNFLK